jgi:hypothetical protein
MALLFNFIACLAVALVLALRDPRRTPITERLFRLIWLSAPGTALLRFAMRKSSSGAANGTNPGSRFAAAAVVPPLATAAVGARSEASLEARVARLEQRLDAIAPPARD